METKFNDFIPYCILKKNWNILLFYCKGNGIPLSTHFARPTVHSVLAWWWPVAAETCSLIMNWFYYITVLVYWVVLDGNISIKKIHYLYSAPDIVRVIKSRKLSWAGHKACVREMDGRDYIGDLVIDGRTKLKSILQDGVRCLQDWCGLEHGLWHRVNTVLTPQAV